MDAGSLGLIIPVVTAAFFKSTRDESGGCLFEMNDVFHVGYIAQVMDNVIKSLDLQ